MAPGGKYYIASDFSLFSNQEYQALLGLGIQSIAVALATSSSSFLVTIFLDSGTSATRNRPLLGLFDLGGRVLASQV